MSPAETRVWRGISLLSVFRIAKVRAYLTSDDVWAALDADARWQVKDPRVMGPVLQAAARQGWIEKTAITQRSKQTTNHRRPVAVWRSNLFEPAKKDDDLPF